MGGAEKTIDPETIRNAESAVSAVTKHARTLPIAPPTQSSARQALDAALDLIEKHGAKVKTALSDPELSASLRNLKPPNPKELAESEDAHSGHDVPPIIMTPESAREHSARVTARAETVIEQNRNRPQISDEKGFFGDLWDGIKAVGQAIDSCLKAIPYFFDAVSVIINYPLEFLFSTPVSKAAVEVSSWLDDSYLGKDLSARFKKTPPVITTERGQFFNKQEEAYGCPVVGLYFPGTNHITVDHGLNEQSTKYASRVVAHEYLHYASYLGGGMNIRFTDSDGTYNPGKYIKPLHEGLTELHAQDLVRSHFNMSYLPVSYSPEVLSVSFLQHLVGKEILKEAYLTGNFTKVAGLVDGKLGKGTFSEFLAKLDNDSLDALSFLQAKAASAKIDMTMWAENRLVKQAKSKIGVT